MMSWSVLEGILACGTPRATDCPGAKYMFDRFTSRLPPTVASGTKPTYTATIFLFLSPASSNQLKLQAKSQ